MADELNPTQREAVRTTKGPLLVLAGAGSGKTRVVTYRIAELIRTGTRPGRILAVTFTNKAAKEMQERVSHRLGSRQPEKPQVSTFHSHCVRVLRRNITRLGYPARFAICDYGDQSNFANNVLREIRCSSKVLSPGDMLSHISRWKSRGCKPEQAAAEAGNDGEHFAALGYRRYQKALKAAGCVDFDDLLLLTCELFEQFPDARQSEAGLFDHILVDEYQDTNGSQYRIVKDLARDHRNLCVVGDDDQSIYGWRGAEVQHILNFARDWPEARIVRLEDNYRCTSAILEFANQLIRHNRQRHGKVLKAARAGGERPQIWQAKSETEEAQMVVADIRKRLTQPGLEARDFAILFRTNEQPRVYETELRKWKIPYVLMGTKSFFDRKEVRDLVAYMRVLTHPRDDTALLRIINTPARGIGQATVEKLLAHAVEHKQHVWDSLQSAEQVLGSTAGVEAIKRFVGLVRKFDERARAGRLAECVRALVTDVKYQGEVDRCYPEPEERESRWQNVEEVVNAVATYEGETKSPRLDEFLDQVSLGEREFDNDKEKQLRRNAVVMLTLHSAKGLEFPQVYMIGMEEGILPHHRSLADNEAGVDEERRLCYVGITRAQDRLTLSLCLTRMKWGKPRPTIPSRFLFEVTGQAESAPARKRSVTSS